MKVFCIFFFFAFCFSNPYRINLTEGQRGGVSDLLHAAFPIMPGGASNNKNALSSGDRLRWPCRRTFFPPRLPFDYKRSITGLLVHSEPAVTRLRAPSPRRQDGVTFHGECQHLFQEVPVSFGPNCRPSTRRLVSESRRGAVTFPSHPNGPVNRACECTPPLPQRTPHPHY